MFKGIVLFLLALILLIFGGIALLILYVGIKTKQVAKEAFGTKDLKQLAKEMKEDYANTSKSVSGMTNLMLPRITKDFPDFNYHEMKTRANNVLTGYLTAIDRMEPSYLKEGNSELHGKLEQHIDSLKGSGQREHFTNIKVHDTEINRYTKNSGRCIVSFQSAVEYYHYIEDKESKVIKGDKDYKYQSKYDISLIYVQDRNKIENELDNSLGVNCPNCGAPVSSLGAKHCEYCGTAIIEINIHAWSFSDIKETY